MSAPTRPGGRTAGMREPIGGRVPLTKVAEAYRLGRDAGRVGYWAGYTDGVNDAAEALGGPVEPDGTASTDDLMALAEAAGVTVPHRCRPTGRGRPRRR